MGSTKKKKARFFKRHAKGGTSFCFYCDTRASKKLLSLDHIIARCRGGTLRSENIVCACKECNNLKSNNKPELWVNRLKQLGISQTRIDSYLDFSRNKVPAYHKGFDLTPQ